MTTANLTHAEATARSAALRLSTYELHLDVTNAPTDADSYEVTSRMSFTTTQPETFVDYLGKAVHSVRVNGEDVENTFDGGRVYLSNLPVGEELTVEITGSSYYSRTGQGLHRMHDQADGTTYLYSHLEPSDARRIFPCFDQPDLKARYTVHLTGPEGWQLLSNQPEVGREKADGGEVAHFAETPLLSTYLTAFAAGPYTAKHSTWTAPDGSLTVELRAFARASMAEYLDDEILQVTAQGMDFFHSNFGYPYPWGKYDSIFVPEYNLGAMENPGLVTFTEHYLFRSAATRAQHAGRTNTILHEMSHMWFGDLVTPQWWDDLWLKESFAEFMGADSSVHATEYTEAWVNFAGQRKNWAYLQDQLPTTHPIKAEIPDVDAARQNFDGITYAKGASVLKQLQAYVGRENFLAGVRRHFAAHAWGNATFDDLLRHLEEASGRDLSFWAQQWLKTSGINTLNVALNADESGNITHAYLTQSGDTLRTHRVAVGLYNLRDGKVVRTDRIEMDIDDASTEIPELIGRQLADIDFLLPNDDDLTYCLIELDAGSLQFLLDNIDKFADPMARTLCWSTAWEMTRAGTMRARDFIQLVARGMQAETELAVLERIVLQASSALKNYADPHWAAQSTLLADALLDGAHSSDAQRSIICTQALAKIRLHDSARDYLRGVLESSADAGLRWSALAALAADGAVEDVPAAADAQLERDNSATGYYSSLRARAAVATAENKRAVWKEIVAGNLTNRELTSKLEGLLYPHSDEFLPTAEFFDIAEKVWSSQSSEVALTTVTGLFPSWDITHKGLERADAFLKKDLPGGLRRTVTEQRDRVARALRNRQVDAS